MMVYVILSKPAVKVPASLIKALPVAPKQQQQQQQPYESGLSSS
jgi:hypothetical protein